VGGVSDLLRIRDDEVISTDMIERAHDGMIFLKSGIGYGVNDDVWRALLSLSHPRCDATKEQSVENPEKTSGGLTRGSNG
jgi:hypothetical protein